MRRFPLSFAAAIALGLASFNADALNGNGVGDYVVEVYVCAPYVLINTKYEGWVYINPNDTTNGMNTTNTGWMLSTALELLSTGRQIGRWYEPTGTAQGIGCGMAAVEITVLSATVNP
jgi:hypothetical protein